MPRDFSPPIKDASYANYMLARPDTFDNRAGHRIIEGIASSKKADVDGHFFDPLRARFELPLPLLWAHDWEQPVGRVIGVKATPDYLFFKARVIDGGLPWAQEIWSDLVSGRVQAVSVLGQGNFHRWNLLEISLCEQGADPDAFVDVVKSLLPPGVVRLDGAKSKIHQNYRSQTAAAY
jgi:hypothetical protein